MNPPLNLDDFQRIARRRLPGVIFDAVVGGAGDEWAVRRNREALASVSFRPKSLVDVTKRSTATCLFGQEMALPVLLAPTGVGQIICRDAELAVARAAARANAIYVQSTMTSCPVEEVSSAAGDGTLWYQLYVPHSRDETEAVLERVARARYKALVITVDTPILGAHERDRRNELTIPVKTRPKLLWEGMSRPAWSAEFIRANHPFSVRRRVLRRLRPTGTQSPITAAQWPVTADDIRFVRPRWNGPLIVKGLMRSDECAQYLDLGVDGFVVSNHGGRQLDNLPGTVDVLAEVVDAVAGRATVLVDGGIRRGEDVLKAIAIGASAVLVGRPYLFALAAGGQAGVEQMIEMLRVEIDRAMALLGVCSLDALDRSFLNVAPRSTASGDREMALTPGYPASRLSLPVGMLFSFVALLIASHYQGGLRRRPRRARGMTAYLVALGADKRGRWRDRLACRSALLGKAGLLRQTRLITDASKPH